MINALHSSREKGTKLFRHKGCTFGWAKIHKMWLRECDRRSDSKATGNAYHLGPMDEIESGTSENNAGKLILH